MSPDSFFRSGMAADLILAIMLLEGVVRAVMRVRSGRGPSLADTFWRLVPGACLVVALRLALTGASWIWLALSLAAAGFCHVVDAVRLSKRTAAPQ